MFDSPHLLIFDNKAPNPLIQASWAGLIPFFYLKLLFFCQNSAVLGAVSGKF